MAVVLAKVWTVYAWQCGDNEGYNFRVTSSGSGQVENHSDNNEPAQEADIFVNGKKVINDADVPAMKAGTSWIEFDSIDPPSGDWTWQVKGKTDCGDRGEHKGDDPTKTPRPPTHTPDPTATDKPRPSATPDPTFTSEPTETPIPPTDTPVPPTNTPRPDPTDTPKPKPSDTSKPPPTSTLERPTASATIPSPTVTLTASPATETPLASETPYVCVVCGCPCGSQTPIVVEVIVEALDHDEMAWAIGEGVSGLEDELKPIFYVLVGIFAMLGGGLILGVYNTIKK